MSRYFPPPALPTCLRSGTTRSYEARARRPVSSAVALGPMGLRGCAMPDSWQFRPTPLRPSRAADTIIPTPERERARPAGDPDHAWKQSGVGLPQPEAPLGNRRPSSAHFWPFGLYGDGPAENEEPCWAELEGGRYAVTSDSLRSGLGWGAERPDLSLILLSPGRFVKS